jgi:hypothetical protein
MGERSRMTTDEVRSGSMELGERGYHELWAFADLRGGHEYLTARSGVDGLEDAWVHGLVIAHQRWKDGTTGGFLLVELDADGGVIDDWVERDFEEATAHGAARARAEDEGLSWEQVPDSEDVRGYIRKRLQHS